jgi:uncharacterized phage infection (PIP) family protein YhgE
MLKKDEQGRIVDVIPETVTVYSDEDVQQVRAALQSRIANIADSVTNLTIEIEKLKAEYGQCEKNLALLASLLGEAPDDARV